MAHVCLDASQENWVQHMKSKLSGKLPRKSKLKKQTKLFISCLTCFVWLFFSFLKFLGEMFF